MRIRLGETRFSNTAFVRHAILSGAVREELTLVSAHPPELAEMLLRSAIDAAPASSIFYALHPERLAVLRGFSISAFGSTGSILVFSSRASALEELEGMRISATRASAASVALLRILLRELGVNAEVVENQEPRLEQMLSSHDAALLIGDDALAGAHAHPELVISDLGEEWRRLTGMPMVYALWMLSPEAARRPELVERVRRLLTLAREYAWKNLQELASEHARRLGIPEESMRRHLESLDYTLSGRHLRALERYFTLAERHGVIPRAPERVRMVG